MVAIIRRQHIIAILSRVKIIKIIIRTNKINNMPNYKVIVTESLIYTVEAESEYEALENRGYYPERRTIFTVEEIES